MPETTPEIRIRPTLISDADRFYEILSSDGKSSFKTPKSLGSEIKYLEDRALKIKMSDLEWDYSILLDDLVVGACGVKRDYYRPFIGELGFFVGEHYWDRGIATKAVRILEEICFNELNLTRLEIRMHTDGCPTEKVAIRAGYEKEGRLKNAIDINGKLRDCFVYAKVK